MYQVTIYYEDGTEKVITPIYDYSNACKLTTQAFSDPSEKKVVKTSLKEIKK